jgi:hypothetical protein
MLKSFSYFFACLLLVLILVQAVAAVNMSICNSIMQSDAQQKVEAMKNMPCHDKMKNNAQHSGVKSICKTHCETLCASLSAMTALPSLTPATTFLVSLQTVSFPHQAYVSITQPNLQRPPILLSYN